MGYIAIALAVICMALSWQNVQEARIKADVELAKAGCVR